MSINKKQFEAFAKFFEKPTRESLRSLIQGSIGETDYLDFKEEWVVFPKLAKHILALSNIAGGAMIFGLKENDDGTVEPVGLSKFLDKEEINKGLSKYIPSDVSWTVIDFPYEESEYPKLKGKKFQVLLVEFNSHLIPFLSLKAGDGIKDNTVYVRRGTSSTEATHDDMQKIVNIRIDSGYSSEHVLALSEHLSQLKELYKNHEGYRNKGVSIQPAGLLKLLGQLEGDKFKDYHDFISELIKKKKLKIMEVLEVRHMSSSVKMKR